MTAQIPDTRPGNYYVTVRDGERYDFLAGLFRDDHQAALDLDKNKRQIAPSVEDDIEPEGDVLQSPSIPPRVQRNSAPGMSP